MPYHIINWGRGHGSPASPCHWGGGHSSPAHPIHWGVTMGAPPTPGACPPRPRPPGVQDALVEVELAHEAGVGQDAGAAAPDVPQRPLQGPAELLHGVGQHGGGRAAQPHAAVHQRPAPGSPAAPRRAATGLPAPPTGPRRSRCPQGSPYPHAAPSTPSPRSPHVPSTPRVPKNDTPQGSPCPQRSPRVPKDFVPGPPHVPSAFHVPKDAVPGPHCPQRSPCPQGPCPRFSWPPVPPVTQCPTAPSAPSVPHAPSALMPSNTSFSGTSIHILPPPASPWRQPLPALCPPSCVPGVPSATGAPLTGRGRGRGRCRSSGAGARQSPRRPPARSCR